MQKSTSYLIIGSGLFGVTTGLELRTTQPDSQVTILDHPNHPYDSKATADLNKIIRADYGEVFYMKLALQAQERWRTDPLYKTYYHETGMLHAIDKDKAATYLENYKSINSPPEGAVISMDEARTRWGGVFRDANWEGVEATYFNPKSGWGEGDGALNSVRQAAIDRGATYREAVVSELLFAEDGSCAGVELDDGEEIRADKTILAVGAWTAKFLADNASQRKDLQVDGQVVAAAAVQCRIKCTESEAEKLKDAPVCFIGMEHAKGESIPPTPSGHLKFNYERSFTNKEYHTATNQTISVPPSDENSTGWTTDVPQTLKHEIQRVVRHIYGSWPGDLENHIDAYRMCWDAMTPNQDWVIAPHPASANLFLATGGSFHSWKFMPIVGSAVVRMLNGTLTEEEGNRWAWDRSGDGSALPEYLPSRDLKDL